MKGHIFEKYRSSPSAEAFKSLRTNIQFSDMDNSIKSILITSSLPSEGKSTVAFNLAITMAQSEKKVLLIDGDLRKPGISMNSNLNSEVGLTNIIVQNMDYQYAINTIESIGSLDIIAAGPIPPNPSEILGSAKMKKLMEELAEQYDYIILDSPPLCLVTDAAILSSLADGVILVCLSGKTRTDVMKKSVEALQKVNANILGVVLNMVKLNDGIYKKKYYR